MMINTLKFEQQVTNVFEKTIYSFSNLDHGKKIILSILFYKYISDNAEDLNIQLPENGSFDTLYTCSEKELSEAFFNRLNSIYTSNEVFNGFEKFVTSNTKEGDKENEFIKIWTDYIQKLDRSIDEIIWSDLFSNSLTISDRYQGKKSLVHSSTPELSSLLARLIYTPTINPNEVSVYDPTSGTGNMLVAFSKNAEQPVNVYGQELEFENTIISKMNLIVNGVKKFDIFEGDTLNNPRFVKNKELKQFDYIISEPPLVLSNWNKQITEEDKYNRWNIDTGIPSRRNADTAFLLHALNSLKDNGTAAILVSNSVLFRGGAEARVRQYFIENNYVEGVIGLASNLLNFTSIPLSIIILSKKKTNKEILFIDATEEVSKDGFKQNISSKNIEKIASIWKRRVEKENMATLINQEVVANNDFSLLPSRYIGLSNLPEAAEGFKYVKLEVLISDYKNKSHKKETGKVIRIGDLVNDSYSHEIKISDLKVDDLKNFRTKIESNVLLVANLHNRLKPSLCNASKKHPVYIGFSIFSFIINEEKTDPSYLILQLNEDYVSRQVESMATGTSIPRINKKDFLSIQILVPNNEDKEGLIIQKSITSGAKLQSDKDKIKQLELEDTIDKILNDRIRKFQWQLHDLRNTELIALRNIAEILKDVANTDEAFANTVIDDEITVKDFIVDLDSNVKGLIKKIGNLFNYKTKETEPILINLIEFIEEYWGNQTILNKSEISVEIPDKNSFEEDTAPTISFDISDLTRILDNILENIRRHANFNKNTSNKNRVKFQYDFNKPGYVSISILNSGNYIKITPEDFFSEGGIAGATGNSGRGGAIIEYLANNNHATVGVRTFKPIDHLDYTFEVSINIKLTEDEV